MDRVWDSFFALELEEDTRKTAECVKDFLLGSELAGAAILSGRSEQSCGPEEMRALEKSVHQSLGKSSSTRYGKFLRVFVEYANRTGGHELPLPSVPIRLDPQPSVFKDFAPVQAERAEEWRLSFNRWIETVSIRDMDSRLSLGAFLVSAALNGGLVEGTVLHQLLKVASQRLTVIQERAHLDLQLPWRGIEDLERRRWFPDAVTEFIFLQLKLEVADDVGQPKTPAKALWPFIRLLFKQCGEIDKPPKNFSEFIGASKALTYHELPVCLGAFMARAHISHSLRAEVWQRLNGVFPASGAPGDSPQYSIDGDKYSKFDDDSETDLETFEWGVSIWSALKSTDRESAGKKLRALLENDQGPFGATEKLLAEWALHLCTKPASSGKRLSLSTIARYVRDTGIRIVSLAGEGDIRNYDNSEFDELYTEVISDASSSGLRNKLCAGLREFHFFLHSTCGVPKISEITNLGGGSVLQPVDANLISLDDYQKIRCRIREADLELIAEDLPVIAELIFILGFRCGLRRMETLMLRIQDVHLLGRQEIIVRRYMGRELKTANAVRRLPLYALLEQDELTLLTDWVKRRKEDERATACTDALFSVPKKGWMPIDQEKVIPILHRHMRAVTGDNSLRYHHLRHSFASWTFLRLSLAHHGKGRVLLPEQPLTQEWLNQSPHFYERLLKGRHRPDLYAVARLLGHASPDMSLEHYIHTMDLAAVAIDERRELFEEKTLIGASGIPTSSAYRLLKQRGVEGLLGRVREEHPNRITTINPTDQPSSDAEFEEGTIQAILASIQRYLKYRQRTFTNREILVKRFGLSLEEGQLLEAKIEYLVGLRSNPQRPQSARHRFSGPGNEEPDAESINLHTEPVTRRSRELYEELIGRVSSVLHEDPDLVWEIVDYYVHNQWKTTTPLIFREPETPDMAKKYLRFLEMLGFQRREIEFANSDLRKRSPYRAQWKEALGLTYRDMIQLRAPVNEEKKVEAKWLFIAPNFGGEADGYDGRSFGYRYFMVMLATAEPVLRSRNWTDQ
ncbi:site-specific integrase [Marinobacter sediminicola]|uniref:site-specific integrase n=1 Tax=Marinobacter sediminicola TaxID=3072994 RepID=UPI0028122D15|nr:site-specific integrase [Marinobacter sp. F26243]